MSHRRSDIRNAVVSILTNAATQAADRIFGARILPLFDLTYPLILVYAREESSVGISSYPAPMARTLKLAVEVRAEANDTLEDMLDAVALQVETAIKAKPDLNQTVVSCNLVQTELDVSAVGEKALGAARLTYEVIYEE